MKKYTAVLRIREKCQQSRGAVGMLVHRHNSRNRYNHSENLSPYSSRKWSCSTTKQLSAKTPTQQRCTHSLQKTWTIMAFGTSLITAKELKTA